MFKFYVKEAFIDENYVSVIVNMMLTTGDEITFEVRSFIKQFIVGGTGIRRKFN